MSDFVEHNINPIYDKHSKILILGSFPSVKSREQEFFYGHPQNRFWRVISKIFNCETPNLIDDKKKLLLQNNIAVWDVIKSCEIVGSSDSSIRNITPNDLTEILSNTKVKIIFVNGKTAEKLYIKFIEPKTNIKAICLPSTSPANAMWTFDKLFEKWNKEIIKALEG